MLSGRVLLSVIAVSAVCQGAGLTGSGSISYSCIASTFGEPLFETLTSSGPGASLSGTCPDGYTSGGSLPRLAYSSSWQMLSISADSRSYPLGGSAIGQVAFEEEIIVLGPASGFLAVWGETTVSGGSDTPSSLNAGLSLDGVLFSDAYIDRRGQLSLFGSTGPASHTYVDTWGGPPGLHTSLTRQFTFYVPFTAGTAMDFSGFLNVQTQGNTIQSIGGTMTFAMAVLDNNMAPVQAVLLSPTADSAAPEPEAFILVAPATLFLLALRKNCRPV